jgi:hypothetical protein
MKKNKRIPFITQILTHSDFCTKIKISFSHKTAGEFFDQYEQNWTYTNLNPITIKGYVSEISPEALVYKTYGLQNMGAKEILCDARYKNYFQYCNKLEIDGDNYMVFREATGNKTLISNRTKKLIRVVITRHD